MSELANDGGVEQHVPVKHQGGAQIWIACALFIVVPTLLILLVKCVFGF